MVDTLSRIKNPETLKRLGQALRLHRERAKLTQGKISGMRQATVSKIENGGDVTLDSLVSYASALGLEITLAPMGQTSTHGSLTQSRSSARALDLLSEFDDLQDAP